MHALIERTDRDGNMAIYYLQAKIGRRTDGQSARAAAAYILRTERFKADNDEVQYSASGHMPDFGTADPVRYWNAADMYERVNGRLYRGLDFALPLELDHREQCELAVSFAAYLTAEEQLPYTLALHAGKGHNPHVHMMISERINDGVARPYHSWFRRYNRKTPEKGGARKTSSMATLIWLKNTRAAWTALANQALQQAGQAARIDHRTLAEQGIDRIPGIHLGPAAWALRKKGVLTDRAALYETIQIANQARPDYTQVVEPTDTPRQALDAVQTVPPLPPDDIGIDEDAAAAPALDEIEFPAPYPAPTLVPAGPAEKPSPAALDRTRRAVERQLSALGSERYEVAVRDVGPGKVETFQGGPDHVLGLLETLHQRNAAGHNIHIRPAPSETHGLVFLNNLSTRNIARMTRDGLEPAVTLKAAPGQYQAWVRAGEYTTAATRIALRRTLSHAYQADRDETDTGLPFSRLAGFANLDIQDETPHPIDCWTSESSASVCSAGPALLQQVNRQIDDEKRQEARAKAVSDQLAWQEVHREAQRLHVLVFLTRLGQYLKESSDMARNDLLAAREMASQDYSEQQVTEAITDGSPELAERHGDRADDYVQDIVRQAFGGDDRPAGQTPDGPGRQ